MFSEERRVNSKAHRKKTRLPPPHGKDHNTYFSESSGRLNPHSMLFHLHPQPFGVGTIVPVLQRKQPRHRQVKALVQGDTALWPKQTSASGQAG